MWRRAWLLAAATSAMRPAPSNWHRRGAAAAASVAALRPRVAAAKTKTARLRRDPSLPNKLKNVPCFFVSNARGSPYLVNKEAEGAQECIIFLDPGDAELLLAEMVQASPMLADARVMCVGLDRALGLLRRPPTKTGNTDRRGRELELRYRIQPAQRALRAARKRLGQMQTPQMLPCFICDALEARGKVPVFLDAADLDAAWLKAAGPDAGPAPCVVENLLDLAISASAGVPGDFSELVFFPSPKSVKYVRRHRRKGSGAARLHTAIGA